MIRLLKMQAYRNIRRPWLLLVLILAFTLIVWMTVAPFREVFSYQAFMSKYEGMKPEYVSLAVLGKARFDLTVSEIYEEFMRTQQDWLFEHSYINISGWLGYISCVVPAFFIGRKITKKKIGTVLVPGQSRTEVFIWLAVRYYVAAFFLIVASLGMVRIQWSVDLSAFPHDYVVGTQLRFVLYGLSIFSGMMLVTFLVRHPVLSAVASLAFVLIATLIGRLIPSISPVAAFFAQDSWTQGTPPALYTPQVIAAIVTIIVFTAASYLIFRRRDA